MEAAEDVQRVLDAYRAFALSLHARGVPIEAVENALVLAAARRIVRRAGAPPLGTIRSLAYFGPVIEEVLTSDIDPKYFGYLRFRMPDWLAAQRPR